MINDKEVVLRCASIISSQQYWNPLLSFMYTHCNIFNEDSNQNSHDEYQSFLNFSGLLTQIFDSYVINRICVSQTQLESALLNERKAGNRQSYAILDILKNLTNFEIFKKQMIQQKINLDDIKKILNEADVQNEKTTLDLALQKQSKQMSDNLKSILNIPENTPENWNKTLDQKVSSKPQMKLPIKSSLLNSPNLMRVNPIFKIGNRSPLNINSGKAMIVKPQLKK